MQINLTTQLANTSLQVGDEAYFVPIANITTINGQTSSSDQPLFLGVISGVGSDFIVLDDNSLSVDAANLAADDYIMFSKNKTVNNASMLGYYAEVQLKNSSTARAELFALSSEIIPSSK
jgi:hypothetical protein